VFAIVFPYASGRGAQAEYVVVSGDSVALVPDGVSLAEAATLPMNGLTARLGLPAGPPLCRRVPAQT